MDESSSRRHHHTATSAIERRRSPRIEILGRVRGHIVSLDAPVVVREMSLGGMAMETAFPFDVGSIHEFRLELGDGSWVMLQGQVRHSRNVAVAGAPPLYVTGIQFVDQAPPEGATTVADLIDKIK
ncbi:MAG TPA: PilZ domain-containing protein [Vicinamibacterales bacterium]|nr:PilZ domain-containing protein [Vicinamibacterales bacterium]